eukprot:EG_transcript_14140
MAGHLGLRPLWCLVCCWLLCLGQAEPPAGPGRSQKLPAVVRMVRRLKESMTDEERADPIIVAESNSHFHPLTHWWIDNMHKLGLKKFVVVALDFAEYRRLKEMGVTVAWHRGLNMNHSLAFFRTKEYNQIVNYKWHIVRDLLQHGHDLLLTDVDIHWHRNPLPYLRTLPNCHIYLASEVKTIPTDDASTETPKPLRVYPPFPGDGFENWGNTGFCRLTSHPAVVNLAEAVLKKPVPGVDDQFTFNTHFNELWKTQQKNSSRTHGPNTCGNYGNLTFHMLRPDLFQNRHIHDNHPQFNEEYYTLHFNWLVDYNEKIRVMIAGGFLNASYLKT